MILIPKLLLLLTAAMVVMSQHLLFIGDSVIDYAALVPNGFVNKLTQHLNAKSPQRGEPEETNIRYHVISNPIMYIADALKEVKLYFKDPNTLKVENATAVVAIGLDDITNRYLLDDFRVHLKILIATLIEEKVTHIVLGTPTLYGERVDTRNEHDESIEDYVGVCKEVARDQSDYIQFADMRAVLMKSLESLNRENLSHSVLTFDGFHLNDKGQTILFNLIRDKLLHLLQPPLNSGIESIKS